jgi:hypothetical protein
MVERVERTLPKNATLVRRMTLSFTPGQMAMLLSPTADSAQKAQQILLSLRKRSPGAFALMYELYRTDGKLSASDVAERYTINKATAYGRLNRLFGYSFLLRELDYSKSTRRVPWVYFITPSVKYAFELWESDGKEIFISSRYVMEAIQNSMDATIDTWFPETAAH